MSIDDLTSTTRVFVSGLPPSLTSKDLRAFFGQKFNVTDAHVLPDRRIGFVGLADHESAEQSAKYFNKSFIRMSKISVELARPVDVKRGHSGQAAPVSQRATHRTEVSDRKPKELKRKRDGLDDGETLRSQPGSSQEDMSKSDKPMSVREVGKTTTDDPSQPAEEGDLDEIRIASSSKSADDTNPPNAPDPQPVTAADSDWLRGKTSRVLDLEGPKDDPPWTATEEARGPDPEINDTVEEVDINGLTEQHTDDGIEVPNGRLFLRNLAFEASEDDLRTLLTPFGTVEEIHLVTDARSSKSKGLAFAHFLEPNSARDALRSLDGKPFHGRLLHILPASDKREQKMSEFEISKLPLKKQKELRRKANASASSFSWNSMYMNPDAVLASVAERLGVAKSDLLDPSSTDAAVKQARAETSIIQETKEYLRLQGINMDGFKDGKRHDRALLLKNFPFGTTLDELTAMLSEHGPLDRLIFPPTGTLAIAVFEEAYAAQAALKSLAYSNVKGSVLYLEKAPQSIFQAGKPQSDLESPEAATSAQPHEKINDVSGASSTVFVRNLNFATTTARLTEVFKPLTGFLSARVKTRTDASRPGQLLSMGFGFVEFRDKQQALAAVATMNGHNLDGHQILVQLSNKTLDAAEERRGSDKLKKSDLERTKIIVKNLPFEASKKDIKSLFGAYGKLRSVRMPKKFDNSARGFAFAEFVTAKEAKNAMEALSSTHLLGRRLVLDFAESEIDNPEETIRAMEKKAGRQSHLTTVNKLITGSARRKFAADARDEDSS